MLSEYLKQMVMKRLLFTLFFSLLLTLALGGIALAQAPSPRIPTDDEVNAIAKQLYCPVCENIPLDVCGTQACEQWRQLIREKLSQGWSEAQIKQYFVDQYGDRVLATPPPRGLNWLVYLVPPLAIGLGAYILYRAIQAWKRPALASPTLESPSIPDDEYVRRLEEELKKR